MTRKECIYRPGNHLLGSVCLIALLLFVLTAVPAFAQDTASDAAASADAPAVESTEQQPTPENAEAPKPKVWNSYDSPRQTMFTFLDGMSKLPSEGASDSKAWEKARFSFPDGLPVTPATGDMLLDILDKLGTVEPGDLPSEEQINRSNRTTYTFFPRPDKHDWVYEELKAFGKWPEGEISFTKSKDGIWTFSSDTITSLSTLAASMAPLRPRHAAPIGDDANTGNIVGLLGPTFQKTTMWQWGTLLGAIFIGLLLGKIVSYSLKASSEKLGKKEWEVRAALFKDLANPASLAILSIGLMVGLGFVHMTEDIRDFSNRIVLFLFVLAIGWYLFNLVDVVEIALIRLTSKTDTRLDDMIVPLIRKTLRIFLVIVYSLFVAQYIFGADITAWIAGLGIAGLAISLAAQDSVKNLFGSLTVFFDKPFLVEDRIKFSGYDGMVEEIGFRSTRIRTLDGHLVTVPNMKFIDNPVENVAQRPYIKRVMNITITYDTSPEKIDEAIQIVKDIINRSDFTDAFDMEDRPPRVYFNDLNSASLNIMLIYWYMLDADAGRDWFGSLEFAERFNRELFVKYGEAGIEFAFPTQTLYLAGDPNRELGVRVLGGGEGGRSYT